MRRSRRIPVIFTGVLAAAILALGACGDSGSQRAVPRSVVVTLQPEPMATVLAGCDTAAFESWYEIVGTLVQTFASESRAGVDRSPEGAISVLNRLLDLRDAIASRPTPECALIVHNAIMLQVRVTLEAYQWYTERSITQDDLREKVGAAASTIETEIAAMLQGTRIGLEQQLYNERATQQAAPPADEE